MNRYLTAQQGIDRMLRLQRLYHKQLEKPGQQSPARLAAISRDSLRLEAELAAAYEQAARLLEAQEALLRRLPGEQEAEALRLIYHKELRMQDAADVMGYCLRQCQRIKQRALKHLDALLPPHEA